MNKKTRKKPLLRLAALVVAVLLLVPTILPTLSAAAYTDGHDDLLLLAVESVQEWNEGLTEPTRLVLKSDGAPDGGNYVSVTSQDNVAMLSRGFDATDISAYAKGYFHLYLYVADASKLTGGQVELTSGGTADNNEANWDILSLGLQNGWNELYLPIDEAGSQGGQANLSAINYFRVFFLTSEDVEVGIDHMSLTNDKIVPTEDKIVITGETTEEWNEAASLRAVEGNAPVGNAYVTGEAEGVFMFSKAFDPLDLTMFKKGYLRLFLYVSNAAQLTDGQIELTSSGNADHNEMNWNLSSLGLKNGWNELYLPIDEAGSQDGQANLSAINYFRVYFVYEGTMTVGIDQGIVTQTVKPPVQLPEADPVQPEEPIPEAEDLLLLAVDEIYEWNEGFAEPSPLFVRGNGAPDGGNWVGTTAQDVAMFSRKFDAVDLTPYKNGYLHLFLYVQNAQALTGGQIELTSSADADSREMDWEVMNLNLQDGWNEVYLPMKDAGSQGGEADLSAINYMRVFFLFQGTNTLGIDTISATQVKKEPVELPKDEEEPEANPQPDIPNTTLVKVDSIYDWNEGFTDPPAISAYWGGVDGGVYVTARAESVAMFSRASNPVDLTAYANGYIHLYLYVEDASKLTGGQVELTSARDADHNEMNWELMSLGLQSGWNEVYLPMKDAGSQGGKADLSAINYMRIYFLYDGTMTVGVDDVVATATKKAPGAWYDGQPPKTGDPILLVLPLLLCSAAAIWVLRSKAKYFLDKGEGK